jgi:hypothetical protein
MLFTNPIPSTFALLYNSFMSQGETLISILLIVIAYLLYHIAKQLSYLTGRKIKFSFFNWRNTKSLPKYPKKEKEEKLTN